MRLLFEMDAKDYASCQTILQRDSARSIILSQGKVAMVYSQKYDYYKFPGGGIEQGEEPEKAMIRETLEETGLIVKPDSIREFGLVHRIQKSDWDENQCFIQDNYYYFCQVEDHILPQNLDAYEAEEGHILHFIDPREAIQKNNQVKMSPYNKVMFEREARVLQMLIDEGLFD
jgi:8-oxo-dGTP pyrophosphatase MutT (NUDIX family)